MKAREMYHYTESGLDNVYLVNGFEFIPSPSGKSVVIQDIDGLHNAIGRISNPGKESSYRERG